MLMLSSGMSNPREGLGAFHFLIHLQSLSEGCPGQPDLPPQALRLRHGVFDAEQDQR